MIPTVLRLNPEAVTSTAKAKMAPTTNRKILTPRLKLLASSRMPRQLTVRRILHASAIYRTLRPALLLRLLQQRQGGAGAADPIYTAVAYSD
jgi:hypothetical protein